MNLLKPIIKSAVTIFILAWALPTVSYQDWATLLIAAVVLTLLQKIVRPILNILFLPINMVTLGLFSLVINVSLLWLATYLVPGFSIEASNIAGIELNQFFTLVLISFLLGFLQSFVGFVL
ncbi:MAG: phage holin family protein [Patescibacteria group bacterium]